MEATAENIQKRLDLQRKVTDLQNHINMLTAQLLAGNPYARLSDPVEEERIARLMCIKKGIDPDGSSLTTMGDPFWMFMRNDYIRKPLRDLDVLLIDYPVIVPVQS